MQTNASEKQIPVNYHSATAEWARFASRDRKSPLGAIDINGERGMVFVQDEVLVHRTESLLIQHLIDKFGAEIIRDAPLLPTIQGMPAGGGNNASDLPLPVKLRFSKPPVPTVDTRRIFREAYDGNASVTSDMAAGVLGLVAELAITGSKIGVNAVATPFTLPLFSANEWTMLPGGNNTFAFPAYAGKARIAAAWQLLEAYRKFETVRDDVQLAVLDGGFWLDGFTPGIPPGQLASDLGAAVWQVNLLDEGVPAGGASPNKCDGTYNCPWHGNGVASIAAAKIGNNIGSAGTGATVAQPVLFKTELDTGQIFRCLTYCIHYGIDVLNMSWGIHAIWELTFPTLAWEECFQFASDNGTIFIAAAGNDGFGLPHYNTRPATRTPGTITVGWLNTDYTAHPRSNFGSSVDIWAPGTNIPVIPDPNNLNGSQISGTSAAAPVVAGVVAMMRAIKSSISTDDVKTILQDTGWKGIGNVTKGMDAYAALLSLMEGELPADAIERNNTAATASILLPSGKPNEWVPFGTNAINMPTALSTIGDQDWYKFTVSDYSLLKLENWCYSELGKSSTQLFPDDSNNRAEDDLEVYNTKGLTRLTGIIAPGNYKIKVSGRINVYELSVKLTPAPIQPDQFEVNNSFETATKFGLHVPKPHPGPGVPSDKPDLFEKPPGKYALTIHHPADQDFFHIVADPSGAVPMIVTIDISQSDQLLDITLFDNDRTVITHLVNKRVANLTLASGSSSYLKITAAKQTRYTLAIRYTIDKSRFPGPLQEEELTPVPNPGDPAIHLRDRAAHFLVDLSGDRNSLHRLVFQAAGNSLFNASVLDAFGVMVEQGMLIDDGMHQAVAVDTEHLPTGIYYLKLESTSAHVKTGGGLIIDRLPSNTGKR